MGPLGVEEERLDRLIAAEQDERRRIALFLHDGPVQDLSGIALMLDATLHSIETGKLEDATKVLATALDRQRSTIRELRDLSFALEPVILRDQGFEAALQALAGQVGAANRLRIDVDVAEAEQQGDLPSVGQELETNGHTIVINKIGASPLPGDSRPCAYSLGKT